MQDVDDAALASVLVEVQDVSSTAAAAGLEDSAVVVFTKGSLGRLSRTLPGVVAGPVQVVLLDDSLDESTREWVDAKFPSLSYHGRAEQKQVLDEAPLGEVEQFISRLGEDRWQLGYCRNYAVVLARLRGMSRILMLDDDIVIPDPAFPSRMLSLLERFDVVGSRTVGMQDDSLIGHLQRAIGWESNSFISGQCMGIKVQAVGCSFPNIYNEDWIFALLQSADGSIARYSDVEQLRYDPFAGMAEKAMFQEFGEMVCDGVARAIAVYGDKGLLTSSDFWRVNCIKRREELVELLSALESGRSKEVWRDTVRGLLAFHDRLDAMQLHAYYRDYALGLPAWKDLLENIDVQARRGSLEEAT